MVRPKKSSYDELETDYFDEEVGGSFLSLMSLAVAFLAVAAFIALAWYAYQDDGDVNGEIETIYAQEGEIRNAPEGESGWQFPDAERQVYQLGSGNVQDMKVEQILPQPERPQARPTMDEMEMPVAQELAQADVEPKTEGWINEQATQQGLVGLTDAERRKIQEAADAADAARSAETVAQIAKAAEPKVEAPKAVVKAPVVKKAVVKKKVVPAKPKKATLTRNRLQLGAFGSRSEALKNWSKIRSRNSSLLGGKQAHIQVAKVKGKTYYRVQAYPFSSRSKADALCVMLKSRNQPCFAVKK